MFRREARLRREYLYKKSLEEKERAEYEKKLALKESLEKSQPISRELRQDKDIQELTKDLVFDSNMTAPTTHVDDEYATATLQDPRIVITTSRDPSSRLLQFAKELNHVIPNSFRMNRGNTVIETLVQTAKSNDMTDIIMIHETRGRPDGLVITHLPYGPTCLFLSI